MTQQETPAPDHGEARERSLHLIGASNFRDLGGYGADTGRIVRWRTLFRSDNLAALTEPDAERFRALGVTRSFDFRGIRERAAAAYALPGVSQYALPIEPTVLQGVRSIIESGQQLTAERAAALMRQTYRNFVHEGVPRFAALFEHLLQSDQPLVFHCTAGKDRTGFAAALILLALDVPMETVMRDYLLTNELYRAPEVTDGRVSPDVLRVLWRVEEDFLLTGLDGIRQDFGDVDAYLERALGLGPAQRAQLERSYLREASTLADGVPLIDPDRQPPEPGNR